MRSHFILYVSDQDAAADFWRRVLGVEPSLHVPGMTEFELGTDAVLGLMPSAGIRRLLGDAIPDPERAAGVPRAEIYLVVDDAAAFHARAMESGARELSALSERNWGHVAAYSLDPDGHVIAFAQVAGGS
jgi:catechol 2,3-dioxygenase-like lactoylglutathione lyase family enzyme